MKLKILHPYPDNLFMLVYLSFTDEEFARMSRDRDKFRQQKPIEIRNGRRYQAEAIITLPGMLTHLKLGEGEHQMEVEFSICKE